jgi:hypothetical protein
LQTKVEPAELVAGFVVTCDAVAADVVCAEHGAHQRLGALIAPMASPLQRARQSELNGFERL